MKSTLSHEEIILLLLQVSVLLIFGKILGEIAKKLKQPAVIGEIIAGIILGPTVLGSIFPTFTHEFLLSKGDTAIALHGLTSIAVILLLFIAGLEVELPLIFGQGKRAISTSLSGILISFSLGFSVPYILPSFFQVPDNQLLIFSLFLGTALSITALPVIARTLMDLGLFKTSMGMLIIAAAMIDDFLGWMIFSVILGMINSGFNSQAIFFTIFSTIAFSMIMLSIGRKLIDKSLPWMNQHLSFPGGIMAFAITLGFLGAAFTESIGIHAIFGSFIVGIAFGDSIHMSSKTKEIIHDFVTNIFAPLFFVSIGLRINFVANFDFYLVTLIIVLAFLGKIIGCGLGSYMGGFRPRLALAVGFGMNARGAMEIILASLALQAGVINQEMFVALVVMALFTSIASGYMMRLLIPSGMQISHKPNGFILLGNNELSQLIGKYLSNQKIPVLITDPEKTKTNSKSDIAVFQGDILKKGMMERLDLSRFGKLLAVSQNSEHNEMACKLFTDEFGEDNVFRLISRKESQSSSLSLPENILFRGIHWNYNAIQRILDKQPDLKPSEISFDSEESLNKFISFHNNKRQIIPLFVKLGKRKIEPVSSFTLNIQSGDTLVYIDIPRQLPKMMEDSIKQVKVKS